MAPATRAGAAEEPSSSTGAIEQQRQQSLEIRRMTPGEKKTAEGTITKEEENQLNARHGPFDKPSGSSAGGVYADRPPTPSPAAAVPDPGAAKSNKTTREKRQGASEWYKWWVQRHREKYGSGSRRSGYKPRDDKVGAAASWDDDPWGVQI
ncbi:hypothetical protein ACHAPT_013280 [Fusarium lateritium]